MNEKVVLVSVVMLFFVGTVSCGVLPKAQLRRFIQHIADRDKAAFMRFDKHALQMIGEAVPVAQEMQQVFDSNDGRIVKVVEGSASENDDNFNPLLAMARDDLNYCTRFLKLLKKYTSLCITDKVLPPALEQALFKDNCMRLYLENDVLAQFEEKIGTYLDSRQTSDEFTVVVTSVRGLAPIIQKRLWERMERVLLFDLDELTDVLLYGARGGIDMQRFYALMKKNIIILSTAALINNKYEMRKQQYIYSVGNVLDLGYEPYIVESCVKGPTFLDDYCAQVVYTETNNPTLFNIGINEAWAIQKFFEVKANELHEDDYIVKLTGRYYFKDDTFIRTLEDNYCDVLAQYSPYVPYSDVFVGLIALKHKYYKNMLQLFDYARMETDRVCIEWEVGKYILTLCERHVPVIYVKELHLYGNGFYHGTNDAIQYW